MTYRSLLVLLDTDPRCAARTQLAIGLARTLDCHLVGLAPTGRVQFPITIESAAMVGDFVTQAWGLLNDAAQQAARQFREACEAAGLRSIETVVVEDDKALALVRHAHCSDLTLLGQADPDQPGHLLVRDMVEQVVLQSARPTLVLPYAGRFDSVGRRVLVAWDDSREATRAITDALPLLQRADQVQLLAWNEAGKAGDATLVPRLEAMQHWLMWHGVNAETSVETTGIGIAEAMLSRAADLDADLLVMGAYGHARLTELMLGGATRGLLAAMTLPVLMSH